MSAEVRKKLFGEPPFILIEAFNRLRTNIRFVSPDQNVKTIMVTSSVVNEGKSSVAINLAKSLAKDSANVLIMDCDLRKPSLNRYMGLYDNVKNGLTSYLCGQSKFNECVVYDEASKLYFLSAGVEVPNPAEMLGSKSFANLMSYLSEKFDFIICDTPPVDVVADAAVLSAVCDGVVFVVRHRQTSRETVRRSIEALKTVNARILGIVLNDYEDETAASDNYRYHYEYMKSKNAEGKRR